jgi:hypothetical protein
MPMLVFHPRSLFDTLLCRCSGHLPLAVVWRCSQRDDRKLVPAAWCGGLERARVRTRYDGATGADEGLPPPMASFMEPPGFPLWSIAPGSADINPAVFGRSRVANHSGGIAYRVKGADSPSPFSVSVFASFGIVSLRWSPLGRWSPAMGRAAARQH